MVATLTREYRLLLLSSSTRHTEKQKKEIKALVRDAVDWDLLLEHAGHHRLLPLLYRTLSSVCPDLVSRKTLLNLQRFYKANATRNFLMAGTILQINDLCKTNSIETLPVKGPLLSSVVYGDIALRSFSDIDILVRDRDIEKLVDLLLKKKYRLYPERIPQDIFLKFLKINHDGRLLTDKGFLFELHRDLADWYTPREMTFERLAPYFRETELLGSPVNDIRPEMLFAYLALHGSKHVWPYLEQLNCIAELLKIERALDWGLLFGIAAEYKIMRRVLLTLCLVNILFEVKLPEAYRQRMADKKIQALANAIISKLTYPRVYTRPPVRFRDKLRYHRKLMDRPRDFISFLVKGLAAPGPEDWERRTLSLSLFPLYYLYKPLRIIFSPLAKN